VACAGLYVASAAQVRTPGGTALGAAAAAITRPILLAANSVGAVAGDFADGTRDVRETLAELKRIREENARLRRDNQMLVAEVALLREGTRLLAALPAATDGAVLAQVIGRDVLVAHSIRLDRGSTHGVRLDAAVLGESGVLGRVDRVQASNCRVQLLSHPTAAAAARIIGVDGEALLSGGDSPVLTGLPPYTSVPAEAPVVTTGSEGIYPPGLLLGTTGEARTEGFFTLVPVALATRPAEVSVVLILSNRARGAQ
jgi:cell shape-determining protein MreC